jgi:uncharacterized damage-inducible protein DinB
MQAKLERVFLDFSIAKLKQLSGRIEDCLGRLSDEQMWARGSENENAVGNLVLHLCGNVRQWICSGVGSEADVRVRDEEFAAHGDMAAAELEGRLASTLAQAVAVLETLPAERLTQKVTIQGYQVSVLEAIYHVVEHFAQHTGQIIFATKAATGQDLGYYRHLRPGVAHTERAP